MENNRLHNLYAIRHPYMLVTCGCEYNKGSLYEQSNGIQNKYVIELAARGFRVSLIHVRSRFYRNDFSGNGIIFSKRRLLK